MILIISESDFGYYQNYTSDNIRNALMGDDICSSAETATKKIVHGDCLVEKATGVILSRITEFTTKTKY